MAKKHSKRTLRTLFNYNFRASEGGKKVVHVEQTNYAPEPQTAIYVEYAASADNTLLDLHNSSYDTRPHSLTV